MREPPRDEGDGRGVAAYQDAEEYDPERNEFELGYTPVTMLADDSCSQDEMLNGLQRGLDDFETLNVQYTAKRPRSMPLSVLRRMYENGSKKLALETLKEKYVLNIDERFIHDPLDANLAWRLKEVRLCPF